MTDEHHYHLHDDRGDCYGDFSNFKTAEDIAAHYAAQGGVEPYNRTLMVIDAPICIDECRQDS